MRTQPSREPAGAGRATELPLGRLALHADGGGPRRGLAAPDFRQIACHGFGEPENAYIHSMAYFKGNLLAGTSRHSLALLKLFPPHEAPALDPWPVRVPATVEDLDMRGQIWSWDLSQEKWKKVHTSPLIEGRQGKEVPRDLGYRGMAVFQGRSDPEPVLYVGAFSTVLRGTAAAILRSEDGVCFAAVGPPGLGNDQVSTFRSLTVFDGHLYVPPAGEGVAFNSVKAPVVLRSADPTRGEWELACEPGFGDPTNRGVFELAIFNNHLYAGTFNYPAGYQIWKMAASGSRSGRWIKVLENGAYRGGHNQIAMSFSPFNGALYVGSAIQNGGYDRTNLIGPASGEIIRIYPDDSWDLVVGEPRETPHGPKSPISGMGPGFDNIFAGYIWRMAAHDGWLYASTFDWSVFLPYAKRPSPQAERLIRQLGTDQIVARGGGFDLWRTRDGAHWAPVTRNGFGNPYNYGGRTLVSTPRGLFLGTANPFGPEVAAKLSTGWTYVDNAAGGAEVWLAEHHAPPHNGPPPNIRARDLARAQGPRSSSDHGNDDGPFRSGTPTVLVTGAAGFVGSCAVERLLAAGMRVRALDLPGAIRRLSPAPGLDLLPGDLNSRQQLEDAASGVNVVCHLAALLPGASRQDLVDVNLKGTASLLQACAGSATLERFVFVSSVAVYDGVFKPERWPIAETGRLQPGGPRSLRNYGWSKVGAEALVRRWGEETGCEYVILRPSTCYGVGSPFVEDLVHAALSDPDGGESGGRLAMQLVHVRDLVEALYLSIQSRQAANETFNIAGLEPTTYRQMARLVRQLGASTEGFEPDSAASWWRFIHPYDVGRAERTLGFVPKIMMREGLESMIHSSETQERRLALAGKSGAGRDAWR